MKEGNKRIADKGDIDERDEIGDEEKSQKEMEKQEEEEVD